MTQQKIKFKEDLTNQLKILFPSGPSENLELLKILKKEYLGKWMSEVEAILLQQSIRDEQERPIKK